MKEQDFNEAQHTYLKKVIEDKLGGCSKNEWENVNLFLMDYGISVLPNGHYNDGKLLDYSEVRRLYNLWWELKNK